MFWIGKRAELEILKLREIEYFIVELLISFMTFVSIHQVVDVEFIFFGNNTSFSKLFEFDQLLAKLMQQKIVVLNQF